MFHTISTTHIYTATACRLHRAYVDREKERERERKREREKEREREHISTCTAQPITRTHNPALHSHSRLAGLLSQQNVDLLFDPALVVWDVLA